MKYHITLPKQSIAYNIFKQNTHLHRPCISIKNDFISDKIIIKRHSKIIFSYQQILLDQKMINYDLCNITTKIYYDTEITESIKIYTPKTNLINDKDIKNIKYNIFYNFFVKWNRTTSNGNYMKYTYKIDGTANFIYNDLLSSVDFLKHSDKTFEQQITSVINNL